MKVHTFRRGAGTLACVVPALAGAQQASALPPVQQAETIVVTAARAPQASQQALGDISVTDRAALERAGSDSLAEVLSRSHGVEYAVSGGPQGNTSLFLRGANANQTLVLIDGIRINSPVTGLAFLEALPVDTLERVEVLRGSASSLYGADAIGGVVNLITRPEAGDRPLRARASAGYGTHGTARASAGLSGAAQGWDYALSAGYTQANGFEATTPANFSHTPDRDGYYQGSFVGSLGYRWRAGHRIGLTAYSARLNAQYDNGPDFMTGDYFDDRAVTRQQVYALSSTDDITDRWQSVLRVGYSKDDQRNENMPAAWAPDGISEFGSEKFTYTWQNNLKLAEGHDLSLLMERLEERVTGTTDYPTDRRQTNSVGAIYRASLGRHHLQANLRNDHISDYRDETTGGLAYAYEFAPGWRAGVAGNTGFRAPTFSDLYYPGSGNPDLRPERSRNVEASLRYAGEDTALGVTVYRNRVKDLIVAGAETGYVPYNVNTAILRGVTLTAEQRLGATTLRASADFQDPHDDETGKQLARRAKQIYRIAADHRIGAWLFGTEVAISGKRYDDAANTVRLGGYTLWNLMASYEFDHGLGVQVRWDNVLDKDYTLANGYRTAGSNVFVNLSWRM